MLANRIAHIIGSINRLRLLHSSERVVSLVVVLLVLGSVSRCGGPANTPTSPTTALTTPAFGSGLCAVLSGEVINGASNPRGPYYHQVATAATSDGLSISGPRQVLRHASVPDGVRVIDGRVLIYYVNGQTSSVWVARLTASGATPLGPISLDGVPNPEGVVDPDATLTETGAIRLAYLSGFGSPGQSRPRAICLAESFDGVNFQVLGPALSSLASVETDPSLIRLPSGSWLMATSRGQETALARSAGGIVFSPYDTVAFGGIPELTVTADGRLRLYVCSSGGIVAYTSDDEGVSWQADGVVVPSGTLGSGLICDPSLVVGAGLLLFKTAS